MYVVIEDSEFKIGRTSYNNQTFYNSLDEANSDAIRRASKSKGKPEYRIFNQVGITQTSLPTEVTVTVNA